MIGGAVRAMGRAGHAARAPRPLTLWPLRLRLVDEVDVAAAGRHPDRLSDQLRLGLRRVDLLEKREHSEGVRAERDDDAIRVALDANRPRELRCRTATVLNVDVLCEIDVVADHDGARMCLAHDALSLCVGRAV